MVVGFPIALFAVTVAALLVFIGTQDTFYYRLAMVSSIAGVTTALLAVLPGAIDLVGLPKGTPARATGIKHASVALLTIGVFAVGAATLYRNWFGRTLTDGRWELDGTIPLAIGVAGMVTLVIVGVLGWTLATYPIGVQPAALSPHRAGRPARAPAPLAALSTLSPIGHRPTGYATEQYARPS
jgi:uncharacterized membrane protein